MAAPFQRPGNIYGAWHSEMSEPSAYVPVRRPKARKEIEVKSDCEQIFELDCRCPDVRID